MKSISQIKSISIILIPLILSACGGGGSSSAPVDTAPVNTAPVAIDDGISLLPGDSITGTLAANDADGDSLSYSIVTSPTNGTLILSDAATGDYSYTHDGLVDGDSFSFLANDGLLDSNIATVTISTTLPAVPASGLEAIPGNQRVTLNWDTAPDADAYNIYWSDTTGTGTGGTKISNVNPPYVHKALSNGQSYYYVITASNAVGESTASTELMAIPANIAPVAVADDIIASPAEIFTGSLKASDVDGDSLTFSIITPPTGGVLTLTDASTGAYTYASSGIQYRDSFTFLANDGLLDSNIATVNISGPPVMPIAPYYVSAKSGPEKITLVWSPIEVANSYNIYWSDVTGSGTSGTKISVVNPPVFVDDTYAGDLVSFDHEGLITGKDYYYVITAVNDLGESSASNEATAVPLGKAISSLIFTDPNLATCVTSTSEGWGLTLVDELKTLNCAGDSISNLEGIEGLTSLTSVILKNNNITDLTPLTGMASLGDLDLSNNRISDVAPLAGLNLWRLNLTGNNVFYIVPLADLTGLVSLSLSSNRIVQPGSLGVLTNLTFLNLSNNDLLGGALGNVDDLAALTGINDLRLSSNITMSCLQLDTVIQALGSPPVDISVATDGVNCTAP